MDGERGNSEGFGFGGPADRMATVAENASAAMLAPMSETMASVKATSELAQDTIKAVRSGKLKIQVAVTLWPPSVLINILPF